MNNLDRALEQLDDSEAVHQALNDYMDAKRAAGTINPLAAALEGVKQISLMVDHQRIALRHVIGHLQR